MSPLMSLTAMADSLYLPHGYCYLWNQPLLLTHLLSDTLIGLSYVPFRYPLRISSIARAATFRSCSSPTSTR